MVLELSSLVENEASLLNTVLKRSGSNSSRISEISGEATPIKFYQLDVIDEQPLLKIKHTSLMHGAVMLYEGEM